MNATEDPTTLRVVAAQLRRESELVRATVGGVAARVAAMAYAGPAADQFRTAVTDGEARASSLAYELDDVAAVLERDANEAEIRAAALRLAGGSP